MKVDLLWVLLVTFSDLLLELGEVVHEHQVFSHDIDFLDRNHIPSLGVQHVVDFLDEFDIELLAFLLKLEVVFLLSNFLGAFYFLIDIHGREV